jgi:hypothetical protein
MMLFFIMLFYVFSGPAVTLYRLHSKRTKDDSSNRESIPAPLTEKARKGLDQTGEA